MIHKAQITLALLALLVLSACGRAELYSGLTEREANEMAAIVQGAGMDAFKSTKDNKTWSLETRNNQFPDVVVLLQAHGYPRDRFDSLGDVFKKQGFVSSPVEERARLNYGLSQELANTLSNIDGVIGARVHLAMPENDPMAENQKPSSASVFIKYDPQVDLSDQVGSIKALVVNSIEGLSYDRVTVIMSPARVLSPVRRRPIQSGMILPLVLIMGGCGLLFSLLIFLRGRRFKLAALGVRQ